MYIKSESIIQKESGRVKIQVKFWISSIDQPVYDIEVLFCPKGKRKFKEVVDTESYSRRLLDMQERIEYDRQKHLEYVTEDEIQQAKLRLWEKLTP